MIAPNLHLLPITKKRRVPETHTRRSARDKGRGDPVLHQVPSIPLSSSSSCILSSQLSLPHSPQPHLQVSLISCHTSKGKGISFHYHSALGSRPQITTPAPTFKLTQTPHPTPHSPSQYYSHLTPSQWLPPPSSSVARLSQARPPNHSLSHPSSCRVPKAPSAPTS